MTHSPELVTTGRGVRRNGACYRERMRHGEFRVQKCKTILDTGWVKARGGVTCLLGKNESGNAQRTGGITDVDPP